MSPILKRKLDWHEIGESNSEPKIGPHQPNGSNFESKIGLLQNR